MILRTTTVLIPALLILPRIFGLTGIQLAQPISDVCTLILSIFVVSDVLKQLKHMQDKA